MDVFALDEVIIERYEAFARSFTRVHSPELNAKIEQLYATRRFWPEPLIQLNPHYETGGSIQSFIETGDLEPECAAMFGPLSASTGGQNQPFELHKHQQQAVSLALANRSFVVTTGTGSGKSLCFFIPIINAAIRARKAGLPQRTRAIVIYPMNALANSQAEELRRYLDADHPHTPTFARLTGQEDTDKRNRIKDNPPDILLTNFMMLEYLMTRHSSLDHKIIENCQDLQFIVLDELHTYRGRQGADVAMLMRRLKARTGDPDHPPICVGTSATMASEGASTERNSVIAQVTSKMFGAKIGQDAVVTETLRRVTDPTRIGEPKMPGLSATIKAALKGNVGHGRSNSDLAQDALAIWIETRVGLKNVDIKPERASPISLQQAAKELAEDSGLAEGDCTTALQNALIGFSIPEEERELPDGSRAPMFAFKLHQFISGAGRLYATLRPEGQRDITMSGQIFNPKNKEERLYPVHFCRNCGQEFHPVTFLNDSGNERFEKREIDDGPNEIDEEDEDVTWGFLMPEPADPEFTFNNDDEDYPETWLEETNRGEKRLKSTYRKRRARLYQVAPNGNCGTGQRCWFTSGKYRFCPTCKDIAEPSARDINKLASLTAESRTSATTILISSILKWMNDEASDLPEYTRKLLAFTDNRQDAALQAGHFNDFIFVTHLRAAILSAIESAPGGSIPEPEIGARIQKALGFLADGAFAHRAEEWLENPGLKGQAREDAEATLREGLRLRFWIDQRRGWRYTSPNLEQLGLVRAEYQYIEKLSRDDDEFVSSDVLRKASADERQIAFQVLFDHMRQGLAVNSAVLDRKEMETLTHTMRGQIRSPWSLEDEAMANTSVLMLDPPKRAKIRLSDEERILRTSHQSKIGKKIRTLQFDNHFPRTADLPDILKTLLKAAKNYGIVEEVAAPVGGVGWRLIAKTIEYHLQTDQQYGNVKNQFFVELYKIVAKTLSLDTVPLFGVEGREHTAQVEGELRELREFRFRYGEEDRKKLEERQEELKQHHESGRFLPTLICSPTMELGVDISSMNVVYLRAVPPTPANYAQRSGRAGRSGQAALILTYCSAQSPHDQYFFDRMQDLVDGIVVPPAIDLRNQDLVRSHLHAEWLATASEAELQTRIPDNLDMSSTERPLLPHISETITSTNTSRLATLRIKSVLTALEKDYSDDLPYWYPGRTVFAREMVEHAPINFDRAFNRWRDLLAAAERLVELATHTLNDYSISSKERKASKDRLATANGQREALLQPVSNQGNDFYLYRYLATEGFLPGYTFPRLPLMAYVPSGADGTKRHYIQRARFLAISEFGPRSLVYHEGQVFRVDRALLKDVGDHPENMLTTHSRAICGKCGAGHSGEHPEKCHVCRSSLGGAILVHNLYRIENVGTHKAERITSNDEDRRRQGFEIQTTFSFDDASDISQQVISDSDGDIATLDFASAALISRINKGLRRRKDKAKVGFLINPKSGSWVGEKTENDEDANRPDVLRQRIVPLVEDRKNALLLHFPQPWLVELGSESQTTLATVQHALARGIEAVFQLEEGEILVEPVPSTSKRNALLFYESAEGGVGALSQLVSWNERLAKIAQTALEIMHYDPTSFDKAKEDPEQLTETDNPECVAGCYRCILSYFNQPDHEYINRRDKDALLFLMRLVHLGPSVAHSTQTPETPDGLPHPDAEPLIIDGTTFPNVWRKARLVVVEEGEADEDIIGKLASKGVKLMERPSNPDLREAFEGELAEMLER